jgi:hypothetical protein
MGRLTRCITVDVSVLRENTNSRMDGFFNLETRVYSNRVSRAPGKKGIYLI